jgi:hypothetical protein
MPRGGTRSPTITQPVGADGSTLVYLGGSSPIYEP